MGKRTTFFIVDRKILNDPLWLEEPFTKGQAWLDLVGRASYEDSSLTKRGELLISERELAKRWKWSRGKVARFLERLEKDQMIRRATNRATNRATLGTTLIVENYEVYQNPRATKRATNRANDEAVYNNINNLKISLNMPGGIREKIDSLYGDRAEALIEDVRRYYEHNPEKEFPGWLDAVAQFNSNQARWGKTSSKKKKTIDDIIAEMEAEGAFK